MTYTRGIGCVDSSWFRPRRSHSMQETRGASALRAMGTLGVGLLMPSSVYSCVHAHLPRVLWAGRRWATRSYTFKGRDVCLLFGPCTEAARRSLTDLANDLLQAPSKTRWSATDDAYVLGGHGDNYSNPDCPRLSMPFVAPAAMMFLLGDVFDGHWQQDDPASVPLLTPHAGGGLDPPLLRVLHGQSVFDSTFRALWGRAECAIVLLLPAGLAPDADASPVPEVVKLNKVPHDRTSVLPHCAEVGQ